MQASRSSALTVLAPTRNNIAKQLKSEENEEIQPDLFGKRIEIIQKIDNESGEPSNYHRSTTKITATNPQVTTQPTPNEEEQSEVEPNVTDQQEDKQTPEEPNPKDFDIPT